MRGPNMGVWLGIDYEDVVAEYEDVVAEYGSVGENET